MKTVIMAGGKGTRVKEIAEDIPKPMIPIGGKPVLQHEIECLARNALTDIIIVTGHLASVITEYFGNGGQFGVSLSYYHETTPLGTAGALYKIQEQLDDDFLLLCGDILFDIDFSRLIAFHYEKKALATLVSHPNSHPFDSSLLVTDDERRVTRWLTKEDNRLYYQNEVNAGIHLLNKALLKNKPAGEKVDLDRDILKPHINTQQIFAYATPEYIKDMGTPGRYTETAQALATGLVSAKNLKRRQRAVFLDRDGTINKSHGFISSPEEFTLIDGAAQAIQKINNAGWLAILVTNQPVIARGEITFEGLRLIHNKMETELGKAGAYLDALYFCPHHPHGGFSGERSEYKIDCICRKPKPGMLLAAAEKYNIDLTQSWMAGDAAADVEAGLAAGCKAAFLQDDPSAETDASKRFAGNNAVRFHRNLAEFIEYLFP